jgi:hypothetical protein
MNYLAKIMFVFLFVNVREAEAQSISHLPSASGMAVGDIAFDEKLDDKKFCICNASEIFQYHSLAFNNRHAFKRRAQKQVLKLKSGSRKNVSGYITIRFIVNCNGEADRFRILSVDHRYSPQFFDRTFTLALLAVVKNFDAWSIGKFEGELVDYYQIVTFKIVNSRVADILP